MNQSSNQVAKIILQQLGGHRFLAMTGVKNLMSTESTLVMKLPRNKSRATQLEIRLDGDDTYTMRFFKSTISKLGEIQIINMAVHVGVYDDMLQSLFTETTGYYTKL